MSASRPRVKRIIWLSLAALLAVLLIAVAAVVIPILTHKSSGTSGQMPSTEYVSKVSAKGDDGRTRTLEVTGKNGEEIDLQDLHAGDLVTVTGTGYNPKTGIYVSFCELPDDPEKKPGPCLGDIPASEDAAADASGELLASAWVSNNWAWKAFATHQYSGNDFHVQLVVPDPVGNGADCTAHACGIVTRADHTAAKDRVQDVGVAIAWDGQIPEELGTEN